MKRRAGALGKRNGAQRSRMRASQSSSTRKSSRVAAVSPESYKIPSFLPQRKFVPTR